MIKSKDSSKLKIQKGHLSEFRAWKFVKWSWKPNERLHFILLFSSAVVSIVQDSSTSFTEWVWKLDIIIFLVTKPLKICHPDYSIHFIPQVTSLSQREYIKMAEIFTQIWSHERNLKSFFAYQHLSTNSLTYIEAECIPPIDGEALREMDSYNFHSCTLKSSPSFIFMKVNKEYSYLLKSFFF